MADTKITGYAALGASPASGDLVEIVDVSDTSMAGSGTNKKITADNLFLYRFPASSTDNAVARYDGTSGTLQDSGITVADVGGSSVTVATTAGNSLAVAATAPAAANGASQAGKAASLTASAAVASLDTAGAAAGGDVNLQAGAATRLTSGNAHAGNYHFLAATGIGTGNSAQILQYNQGSVTAPSFAWDIGGNRLYGLYYSAGTIRFSINGVNTAYINNFGLVTDNVIGNNTTPGATYGFKTFRFDLSSSTTLSSGSYNGATLTNSTAGAGITSTLVTAAQGWNHRFVDDNATHRWTIKPNTADTIIWTDGTVVTAATGSIVSTARYDYFEVEALDATVWLARNVRGTWTVTP